MASTMPPVTTRARRTSSVRSHPLTCSNRIAHSAEYSLRYGEESGTAGGIDVRRCRSRDADGSVTFAVRCLGTR
jgi:hypothetical protein